jgi:hypothetical protein
MDTRQLETLLAIEQHGGFAAAEQAVNLTASAISQQVAALEAELGAELLVPSRFVWVGLRWPFEAVTRCCGREVRRVWRVDLTYRSA